MELEKKTKGRQKIEIKKMEDESRLLVTFSKRRSGLFKKASEISTLCRAEVAILVLSPHQKVYSFGHPDVDTVIDRFLTGNPQMAESAAGSSSSTSNGINLNMIMYLNELLTGWLDQVKEEKDKGKRLDLFLKPKFWWEKPIEELEDLELLDVLQTGLKVLKGNVMGEAHKRLVEAENPAPFLGFNSLVAAPSMDIDNNTNSNKSDSDDQNFGHGP